MLKGTEPIFLAPESFEPGYVRLSRSGELAARAGEARRRLEACSLCPRHCGVNRVAGGPGACQTGVHAHVASASPHFGEEAPLVGTRGSGTIFFARCNLNCEYCQNYDISQVGVGRPVGDEELAGAMLGLQERGCHNINLVSPSHVVAQVLAALTVAAEGGLRVPLVYNTGGYDSAQALRLLDGVVDIYMPDMKYFDPEVGLRYSGVPDYPEVNRAAVLEMHRQVGDLICDQSDVALRGLLVRHLVLPNGLAGTASTLRFIAEELSRDTYVNIMDQYRPCHRAREFPELNRRIASDEYEQALRSASELGLRRLDRKPRSAWLGD